MSKLSPTLSIYETTFAPSYKSDAILVVEGKKLHVNKALLSYHSDYFNTLFNSEFKEKSQEKIEIKDVNFEDFAVLLSLIHKNPIEITKPRIEKLLVLADQFLLTAPKLLIEQFISSAACFNRFEKLKLADKYKLDFVFERALKEYNSRGAFGDFQYNNSTFTQFSNETKIKICEKFFGGYAYGLEQ